MSKKNEKLALTDAEKYELNLRINQIRLILFDDNNRNFANTLGVNEQNISNICSVQSRRNASLALVKRIIEQVPEVSATWLITGEGEMLKKTQQQQPAPITEASPQEGEAVVLLKDLLREKEERIIALEKDLMLLRFELARLQQAEGGEVQTTSQQPISTDTEISII